MQVRGPLESKAEDEMDVDGGDEDKAAEDMEEDGAEDEGAENERDTANLTQTLASIGLETEEGGEERPPLTMEELHGMAVVYLGLCGAGGCCEAAVLWVFRGRWRGTCVRVCFALTPPMHSISGLVCSQTRGAGADDGAVAAAAGPGSQHKGGWCRAVGHV